MNNPAFSNLENEMLNFDFEAFKPKAETAKAAIATPASIGDLKTQICAVWSQIGKFVRLATGIPVIGKFIAILVELLDTICGA